MKEAIEDIEQEQPNCEGCEHFKHTNKFDHCYRYTQEPSLCKLHQVEQPPASGMTKKFNDLIEEIKSMFTVSQAMARKSFDSTQPIKGKTDNPDPEPSHKYPEQPPAGELKRHKAEREAIFSLLNEKQLPICGGMRLDTIIKQLVEKFEDSEAGERILEERIEKLSDTLDRSETSRDDYERRLKAHSAGEAVKHFCRECRKPFWNVDDEPIICPHCGSKEMPVPDIDAEQIA